MSASSPLSICPSFNRDSIMCELPNIEFLSMSGAVVGAGDTLVVKETDKASCSHEGYILLGKKDN